MNVLSKVTWKAMWRNRVRTLVTIAGIILSAAMFTAVTTLGVSLVGYLIECTVYNDGDYFIRYDYSTDEQLVQLRQEDAVSQLGDLKALGYSTFYSADYIPGGHGSETCVIAAGDEDFFDMVSIHMEEGRLPETADEIVITRNIYYYLKEVGKPCEVGEILTLDVVPEYVPDKGGNDVELPAQGAAFQKSYLIVGISETFTKLQDENLNCSHLFTRADGTEIALWHRLYVKTSPAMAAHELRQLPYGMVNSTNYQLLNYYGASQYINYNYFIYGICAVLMVIILVGSVSLIYNAFSISVSERTKQFGLLSSVGATKRQLRKSVYFEALTLSGFGVPIGIFCGYFGIAVTLRLTGGLVDDLMAGAVEGNIALKAIPSIPAFLCAGMVAVLTVLISAWIPARSATSIPPITAIRQNQEYQIPKKGVKGNLERRNGFPNALAQRYYQVSRRKYRSTVLSLTVSLVLFLAAAALSQELQLTAQRNANSYNFDFEIYVSDSTQVEEIQDLSFVSQSVLALNHNEITAIPDEAFTDEYVQQWERAMETWYGNDSNNVKQASCVYLEDEAFLAYLKEHHIDPEPYFEPDDPTALVCTARFKMLTETENGLEMVSYSADMLRPDSPALLLYSTAKPDEIREFVEPRIGGHWWYTTVLDGMPVWEFQCTAYEVTPELVASDPWIWPDGSIRFAMKQMENGDFGYYLIDPESGELNSAPTGTVPNYALLPRICVGSTIDELPFGVADYSGMTDIVLVLPMSVYPGEETPELLVKISDYQAMKQYLDEEGISYSDHMEQEMQHRNMVTMTNVFSGGFIALISLICVCNIFNTISTNIALRRRDFGMLRSVGMQTRELHRMVLCECLTYGCHALIYGLPLGLLAGLGIHCIGNNVEVSAYTPPFGAILTAVGVIFLVVFASMGYAVSKLKRDNPIDAIRMENI